MEHAMPSTLKSADHGATSGGPRRKMKPSTVEIECGHSGGYIVRHRFDNNGLVGESYRKPEVYVVQTLEDLYGHLDKHLGGKDV